MPRRKSQASTSAGVDASPRLAASRKAHVAFRPVRRVRRRAAAAKRDAAG
ncbi:MAG: hypothetical protein ACJ8GN_04690 [Longimicrobiaceae bacterium]